MHNSLTSLSLSQRIVQDVGVLAGVRKLPFDKTFDGDTIQAGGITNKEDCAVIGPLAMKVLDRMSRSAPESLRFD